MIKFKNTLTKKIEEFIPIKKNKVKMYTCGPTVYDYAHIGNFRTYIFEDLLRRYLKFRGYKVIQVMNLTDVDDKTIKGSIENKISLNEYTKKYIEAFFEDIELLNIERAEYYPRATEHINEMIELIKRLINNGIAYQVGNSVYYSIGKFKDYGKLSGIVLDELQIGKRVNADEYDKENPQDFALWKEWTEDDGDVFWESPWGKGRPGWHIECSAMSMKYLGETFDIHTGGVDNIFPHHENEIAQSTGATGKKFVNYWLHSEHLIVEGKKMSKSLGNFFTLRDLINKGFSPLAIRFILLTTHYRKQLNFTFEGVKGAESSVDRIAEFRANLRLIPGNESGIDIKNIISKVKDEFICALDDDLNASEAIASIFNLIYDMNQLISKNEIKGADAISILHFLDEIDSVLGFIKKSDKLIDIDNETYKLIELRDVARKQKNYALADEIRKKLLDEGIVLEDRPSGTVWKRK